MYVIFEASSLRRRGITDSKLIPASMALLGVEVVRQFPVIVITSMQLLAVVWLAVDLPKPSVIEWSDDDRVWTCASARPQIQTIMLLALLVYNFGIMSFGSYLAFQTRNVNEDYNEAKYIGSTLYATLFVSCIIAYFIFFNPTRSSLSLAFTVKSAGILLATFTAFFLLIGTKIYSLYYDEVESPDRTKITGMSTNQNKFGPGSSVHQKAQMIFLRWIVCCSFRHWTECTGGCQHQLPGMCAEGVHPYSTKRA